MGWMDEESNRYRERATVLRILSSECDTDTNTATFSITR